MHRIEALLLLSGTQMLIFFVCSNVNDGFRNRLNHKIKIFLLDRQQMDKTNCLTLAAHARVA